MRARAVLAMLLGSLVLALAACGDGDEEAPSERSQLTVSAAASLKTAFTRYGRRLSGARARFSFAGSDELAAQIRQGVKPDVYAAADTELPEQLFAEGLVEQPTVFAGNRLVLAVPAGDAVGDRWPQRLGQVDRVQRPVGRTDVGGVEEAGVDRPLGQLAGDAANVRSEEPTLARIASLWPAGSFASTVRV